MQKPPSPESHHLNNLLWRLDLLNEEAARMLGISERTIYRWLSGTTKIPASALKLLEVTLRLREADVKG